MLIIGAITGLAAVLGLLKLARAILRSEISEALILSLGDTKEGAGKRVQEIVRAAIQDTWDSNPLRERVNAQHDRLMTLEKNVLDIVSKYKKAHHE